MKNKILSLSLFIMTILFLLSISSNLKPSIPISDIATMTINEDGYYQLTIKDISHVNDNVNKISYEEIMNIVNK